MKRKTLTLFIIFTCLSLFNTSVTGQTLEDEKQYNVVRGEEEELLSYYHNTQSLCHTVLLRFDLSEAPEGEIKSAKLRLYGTAEPGGGIHPDTHQATPENHTIAVYNMNYNLVKWDESTFMYNHWEHYYRNSHVADHQLSILSDINGEGWFEWDLTEGIVNTIKAGDQQLTLSLCNTSTMISPDGENKNAYMRFHSKEHKSGNTPVLSFTYDLTHIQNSSIEKVEYHLSGRTLTINSQSEKSQLNITDITGRRLHQATDQEYYHYTFPTKGIYILSLQEGNKQYTQKLSIQ